MTWSFGEQFDIFLIQYKSISFVCKVSIGKLEGNLISFPTIVYRVRWDSTMNVIVLRK